MSVSPLTPADLARQVGVSGVRVNGVLRQLYPASAPGKGGRWELTTEQVATVIAYFAGRSSRAPSEANGGTGGAFGSVTTDWFWEGNVQTRVAGYLESVGWTITTLSNTAARAQGPDIEARRGGQRLMVEVKGFPSVGYRDPRRANEVKRTNPTLQAKHWFADAVLKALRYRGTHPNVSVAIAFPDFPRYRSLLGETGGSLNTIGVAVLVVDEQSVSELLPLPRR